MRPRTSHNKCTTIMFRTIGLGSNTNDIIVAYSLAVCECVRVRVCVIYKMQLRDDNVYSSVQSSSDSLSVSSARFLFACHSGGWVVGLYRATRVCVGSSNAAWTRNACVDLVYVCVGVCMCVLNTFKSLSLALFALINMPPHLLCASTSCVCVSCRVCAVAAGMYVYTIIFIWIFTTHKL